MDNNPPLKEISKPSSENTTNLRVLSPEEYKVQLELYKDSLDRLRRIEARRDAENRQKNAKRIHAFVLEYIRTIGCFIVALISLGFALSVPSADLPSVVAIVASIAAILTVVLNRKG